MFVLPSERRAPAAHIAIHTRTDLSRAQSAFPIRLFAIEGCYIETRPLSPDLPACSASLSSSEPAGAERYVAAGYHRPGRHNVRQCTCQIRRSPSRNAAHDVGVGTLGGGRAAV